MWKMIERLRLWAKRKTTTIVLFGYGIIVGTSAPLLLSRCAGGGLNCGSCGGLCGLSLGILPLVIFMMGKRRLKLVAHRLASLARRAVVVALLALSLALVSCNGTTTADSVALDYTPGYSMLAGEDASPTFSEEGSTVLRCTSLVQNERGIVVTTSKSKDMKANILLFLKVPPNGAQSDVVQVAWAPIKGKEYEYDMTQARFYTLSLSSATAAMKEYGIPYSDWQAGACNSSEKFPCCE